MRKLLAIMAVLTFVACTPPTVENENEQFGIDKEEVQSPADRD
ncbi:hypothetical protein [Kordia sp.]